MRTSPDDRLRWLCQTSAQFQGEIPHSSSRTGIGMVEPAQQGALDVATFYWRCNIRRTSPGRHPLVGALMRADTFVR